jgi:hypothetical protein
MFKGHRKFFPTSLHTYLTLPQDTTPPENNQEATFAINPLHAETVYGKNIYDDAG